MSDDMLLATLRMPRDISETAISRAILFAACLEAADRIENESEDAKIGRFVRKYLSNKTGVRAVGKSPDGFWLGSDKQDDHGETVMFQTIEKMMKDYEERTKKD